MPEWMDIALLLGAGAFGGLLSGLLGVGGGIIFIPILDVVLSQYGIVEEEVKFILANSLSVIIFTGLFNSYRQYRSGNFFPKYILYTAIPGMFTVLLGSWIITLGTWYEKKIFNIVFAVILIPGVIRMLWADKEAKNSRTEIAPSRFSVVGAVTGIFTAFSGLGGGLVMIPAFVNMLKLEMKKAVSVSAGVVPFFALPSVLYYMAQQPLQQNIALNHTGFVIYPMVLPMIAGSLITVPMGVKIGHAIPPAKAKTVFAVFVVLVLIKMFWENLR